MNDDIRKNKNLNLMEVSANRNDGSAVSNGRSSSKRVFPAYANATISKNMKGLIIIRKIIQDSKNRSLH